MKINGLQRRFNGLLGVGVFSGGFREPCEVGILPTMMG